MGGEPEADAIVEELRVTETELRQQAEELEDTRHAVESERARYRALFDFAPDAYLVTDRVGLIAEANVAAGALLGVPATRLVGKPMISFVRAGERRGFRALLTALATAPGATRGDRSHNRPGEYRVTIEPREGAAVPVAVTVAGDPSPSRPRGGVHLRWMLRDITDRVLAEERLLAANVQLEDWIAQRTSQLREALDRERRLGRAKHDFLSHISHELRTPLHALLAYTELLEQELQGPVNEAQRQSLQRMRQSEDHLLGLVARILEFARVEGGHVTLDVRPVALADAVGVVVGMFGAGAVAQGGAIVTAGDTCDLVVRADPEALRQVLINLVGNAVKYSPPNGRVEVLCEGTETQVVINVTDHGPGIAPEQLDLIFEPFVQVADRTLNRRGTGLGLAISRSLAEAMGGRLTVSSEVGQGSTFALWLPRATGVTMPVPAPPSAG